MLSGSEFWLLRLMAERGAALLDTDHFLVVLEERGELEVVAAAGTGNQPTELSLPVHGSALGQLFGEGRPRYLVRPKPAEAPWLEELGLSATAVLVEPFSLEPYGAGMIVAARIDEEFGRHDQEVLTAFARNLAARLSQERLTTIERLRYGQLMREHERRRWARELHDETIQGLGALRIKLASARETEDPKRLRDLLDEVLADLDREIEGIRHLITELRPAALDDLGLADAVEALARRVEDIYNLTVRTEMRLTDSRGNPLRFEQELESTVYRIVQEALSNVARHADARRAEVRLWVERGQLWATITDDGRGISDEVIQRVQTASALQPTGEEQPLRRVRSEGGFGLPGMVERAELVGGSLRLERLPTGGTKLTFCAPLTLRPDENETTKSLRNQ